jgi:hypothetical protein
VSSEIHGALEIRVLQRELAHRSPNSQHSRYIV